ncbi:MAG: GumC family protein, partial [Planctomycetaceae bacterium]
MTNSHSDTQSEGRGGSDPHPHSNGNPVDPTALAPWKPNGRRPTGHAQAAARKPIEASIDKHSATDLSALWAALRRRWFLASFLGLTFAAISAGLTWMLMPTKFTTFSELFISSRIDSIIWEQHESEKAFDTYKQTNMKLVASPFVLHAALRRPEINNLAIINEQENPLKWLEEELKVSSPQMEFIKISLTSTHPRDATALVNAVTEAYLEEAVNQERNKKLQRKSYLERVSSENEEKLRSKRNTLKRLAMQLETSDSNALTDRQKMQIELLSQTRREHTTIRFELMRYKAQLSAKESNLDEAEEIDIPELVIEHEVLQDPEVLRLDNRKKNLEKLIAKTSQTIKDENNPILVSYRQDLESVIAELEAAKNAVRPTVIDTIKAEKQILTKSTINQLKNQIEVLTQHEQQLATEIKDQEEGTKKFGLHSYELEALKQEILQQEEVDHKLAEEQQKIEIELSQPSRIASHRKAEVPLEPEMRQKYMMTAFAGFGVLSLIVSSIVWLESAARRISTMKEV